MQSRTKRIVFDSRSSSELAQILEGIRRGGYENLGAIVSEESAHARARLIRGEKNREAGRTINRNYVSGA